MCICTYIIPFLSSLSSSYELVCDNYRNHDQVGKLSMVVCLDSPPDLLFMYVYIICVLYITGWKLVHVYIYIYIYICYNIGWKLVHGDVFRPPSTSPMLFSVMVGSGTQLCLMFLGIVI
jgi:hypothetical protein